ncbi:MAG: ATP-binding cassette domain-containing protein [Spirochaetales bacterium]|nr:ATP-binding cassette domain-containing protein [Spirochaetales bacterium]
MIEVRDVHLRFEDFYLQDINLRIEEGCFFVLMGPTGAGKTVLLEAIAGHHRLQSGTIMMRGHDVTRWLPEERRVGIVYQDYALFPHLSVEENVRFASRYLSDDARRGLEERFGTLVTRLNLRHLLHRKPATLSGGEAQRTALARALLPDPDVVLLDEPLSALDPAFRGDMRDMLGELHAETGKTFVVVTHDFAEARELGSKGAILNQGRIAQAGTIEELFEAPVDEFVARFTGVSRRARG